MTNADPIYERALARLSELEAECQELKAFFRTYQRYSGLAGALRPVRSMPAEDATTVAMADTPKPASTAEVIGAVMKVIAEHKAPMPLADIYTALTIRGVVVGGKIPRNNLGAKLSAEPLLRTGPSGWWFVSDPYPSQFDGYEYEEGPDTEAPRPLQSNGAAVGAA